MQIPQIPQINNLSKLDLEQATNYMYFNIDRIHFESINSKAIIKKLFEDNWFNKTNKVDKEIKQLIVNSEEDIFLLNSYIEEIRNNVDLFNRLFHYPLKRTGNAEVMLYLLIQNSYLSASSTSGRDIIINNEHYEIKNCIISKKYNSSELYFSNFKLGCSFCILSIINKIEKYFNFTPKGSEMSNARNSNEFLEIEDEYRNIVYDNYFSKHKMLFIDKYGKIHFIGYIKKENIFIDTITEGTIKPMIKIQN